MWGRELITMKRTARVIHRVSIDNAQTRLGRVALRVRARNEYAILEKDGVPLAGVVAMDEFEDYLELQDPGLKQQIAEGYAEYLRGEAQPVRDFLAGLKRRTKPARKK